MFVGNILCLRIKTHWPLILVAINGCVLLLKLLYHGIVFLEVIAVVHWALLHNLTLWKLIIFLLNAKQMLFEFSIVLVKGSWRVRGLHLDRCGVVGSATTFDVGLRAVNVLSILGLRTFERGISAHFVFGTHVTFDFSDILHWIYLRKLFLILKAGTIYRLLSSHNTESIDCISPWLRNDRIILFVLL